MGEVIPFRTRKEFSEQRAIAVLHQELGAEHHECCAVGCNSQADACFEFVDIVTGTPMFKHYCAKHLNKGDKGVLK